MVDPKWFHRIKLDIIDKIVIEREEFLLERINLEVFVNNVLVLFRHIVEEGFKF